jgi:diamine N-acetyltransferase
MTSIVKATGEDVDLLSGIATVSFLESHGHSAPPEDINKYVYDKFSIQALREELLDAKNIYHIIYFNGQPVGYSKIIFDQPFINDGSLRITKLDRLYLLEKFQQLKLGSLLFAFIVKLARENGQSGILLFVWKQNEKAVNFYKKHGFTIIGTYDFKISATHSNPNHQMFLLLPI